MANNFSKRFPGEFNETNFENPLFTWEFNLVSCKISEVFHPRKFLPLLSSPYSLFKSSRWEIIWNFSDLKTVTGNLDITYQPHPWNLPSKFKHPPHLPFYSIPEIFQNLRWNTEPVKKKWQHFKVKTTTRLPFP